MSSTDASRRLTERELMDLPDDGRRHELLEGFLLAEPPPGWGHGALQGALAERLRRFARERRIGRVVTEVGFVLSRDPDTVLAPDLAFVSRERLERRPPDPRRYFDGAPDLAIEILSPSNRLPEIHAKVADYLAAGSKLVWVVDPQRQTVTTYRTLLAPVEKRSSDVLSGEDVLPGLEVAVGEIFED